MEVCTMHPINHAILDLMNVYDEHDDHIGVSARNLKRMKAYENTCARIKEALSNPVDKFFMSTDEKSRGRRILSEGKRIFGYN